MKIYTKSGDEGETSLVGGRVKKNDRLISLMGELDELNSFVGLARTKASSIEVREQLTVIQHALFDCGSDLMYVEPRPSRLSQEATIDLESWIDTLTELSPPLDKFILPGGTEAAATLHVARTVCRRVERSMIDVPQAAHLLPFINRLSDFFFTAARYENAVKQKADIEYVRSAHVFKRKDGEQ
ncbi:cob(I)yrinic acid a,c-diamide adenosyltransferase [Exiguobacterium indicum]|uniref:Corrinoid adenosyltransferase n=1 Tax=Exiguobacterium indicum TaxID=296995 RepID=A0A0V8GGF3_9BACL|nr:MULTISPECIES: cob(I)yrinic acid a,c-diamide adenosyltransferase [Exiguobacterium]AHA29309.1 ATP:cob(I)alamin adenosyltransferase [Exiguobacterium sp. MH3]KSU49332.1 cobalamin adenosyltransferase [Exiguobacterium enclense]KTR28467.1 ATP:cob(I)alamin adenosyltransferase [Exiguobacterium indicum]MCQ4090867.1 cob(I)yrinic acid a,c-diamide adenosyltransferase [Exiguobacterium sp. LL15]SDC54418.1 cob(I)alamin adenosyltransferase [Exiguobacterium enclense]